MEIQLQSEIFMAFESGVALRLPPHSMTPQAGAMQAVL